MAGKYLCVLRFGALVLVVVSVTGCIEKNSRREFVDLVMAKPDKLDSICSANPIAQEYAQEFLSHQPTRAMVIDVLSSFNGEYDVVEENNEMAHQPYADRVQRAHHVILTGSTAKHNVDFQFFTEDGTTWELTNIIIVGGDMRW